MGERYGHGGWWEQGAPDFKRSKSLCEMKLRLTLCGKAGLIERRSGNDGLKFVQQLSVTLQQITLDFRIRHELRKIGGCDYEMENVIAVRIFDLLEILMEGFPFRGGAYQFEASICAALDRPRWLLPAEPVPAAVKRAARAYSPMRRLRTQYGKRTYVRDGSL